MAADEGVEGGGVWQYNVKITPQNLVALIGSQNFSAIPKIIAFLKKI